MIRQLPYKLQLHFSTLRFVNEIKCVYHLFSLTELYLPSVIEYNTTCFGPRCGPSLDVTYR